MVEIRALVDEMQLAEHKLLAEREQTNRATLKSALRNVLVNVSIGIAALAAVWYLMYRYLQVVEKAATAIHNQRRAVARYADQHWRWRDRHHAQGQVTLLNHVAQRLTGWRGGRRRPTVDHGLQHRQRRDATVDNPAERALREGAIVGLANHTILIAKDASNGRWMTGLADSHTGGRSERAILVFREITERKQHEQKLTEQANELAEARSAKNEFLATLAHQLASAFAAEQRLAAMAVREGQSGRIGTAPPLMVRQLRQMTRLIHDLLDSLV